ncbi:MAG: Rrf2 family transcriptional regulator [Phycisphaeraceae bacterium]|nr:Rrf2 family transcriptional regulator [Phycisphaeraceae bacterium]
MIYSNACRYAIRALSRLAMLRPDGYVLLDELCQGTDLPRHFVAKIFQDLVRKGLLVSAKGRGGGFALAKKPEKIMLVDIVAAIDGIDDLDGCAVGMAECNDQQPCPHHDQWAPIRAQLKAHMMETNLQQMGNALRGKLDLLGQDIPKLRSVSKPVRIPTGR